MRDDIHTIEQRIVDLIRAGSTAKAASRLVTGDSRWTSRRKQYNAAFRTAVDEAMARHHGHDVLEDRERRIIELMQDGASMKAASIEITGDPHWAGNRKRTRPSSRFSTETRKLIGPRSKNSCRQVEDTNLLKDAVIQLVIEQGQSLSFAASSLGLGKNVVAHWKRTDLRFRAALHGRDVFEGIPVDRPDPPEIPPGKLTPEQCEDLSIALVLSGLTMQRASEMLGKHSNWMSRRRADSSAFKARMNREIQDLRVRSSHSSQDRERAMEMLRAGSTPAQVATELSVPCRRIWTWISLCPDLRDRLRDDQPSQHSKTVAVPDAGTSFEAVCQLDQPVRYRLARWLRRRTGELAPTSADLLPYYNAPRSRSLLMSLRKIPSELHDRVACWRITPQNKGWTRISLVTVRGQPIKTMSILDSNPTIEEDVKAQLIESAIEAGDLSPDHHILTDEDAAAITDLGWRAAARARAEADWIDGRTASKARRLADADKIDADAAVWAEAHLGIRWPESVVEELRAAMASDSTENWDARSHRELCLRHSLRIKAAIEAAPSPTHVASALRMTNETLDRLECGRHPLTGSQLSALHDLEQALSTSAEQSP